ncbi:GDP-mannose 4,6-dehydratase [Ramlibacter tataouinensis]|uniref:NAD-dependent epimerase/dehydratase family protein n=1 Tax=Ramlibacter tataouinensis TaxID=94132 RepID=UPI0022F3B724|nr:GDP-mannose 4,6-dehydratase [Ramlibacter tataouinensis]WBY03430.1 GDP-mannose 4,6-dehydratase [Ramlibacter tataouinensis]
MRKVFVTGAGGFTGRHMAVELAAHDYEPIGFFGTSVRQPAPEFRGALVGNLLDPACIGRAVAAVQPDLVVHLAGQAFVDHGNADELYRTNLLGTRNLLEALAALAVPPAMTLLASSANVYGNAEVELLDETIAAAPANDYAVSKLAMEYMAGLYRHRLPLVVTRPFNYTGVGQTTRFLIPKIVDHARRRAKVIELGNLDVARDFSDVRVVATAYRRLLECPGAAGRVVNVCSGQALTLREILQLVQAISGHELPVRVNPALVRANEVRKLRGSRALLESLTGPLAPIALRDTLAWMLE